MKALGARFSRAVNRVFERSRPVMGDRYSHTSLKTQEQVRGAFDAMAAKARRDTTGGLAEPHTQLLLEAASSSD